MSRILDDYGGASPTLPLTTYEIRRIDPSAALRTPVRAGPNGADRMLGDKGRRVMEIF